MDWNPFEGLDFLDPIYDDDLGMGLPDELPFISFYDSAIILDDDDSLGSSSQHSPTRFQALAEDNSVDFSLLCGNPEPIQFQVPHQLVDESSFERRLLASSPLDDSNKFPFEATPMQLFTKPSRRAVCDPCRCEALLLKLMPNFEEAGRLGPIENARRYTANLKRHLGDGNSSETLRQPINISRQNVWLVDNLFDASGGFLYCSQVIRKIFHLGSHRLSRLRLLIGAEGSPKMSIPESLLVRLDIPSTSQQLTAEHISANKLTHLVVLSEEVKWRSNFKQVQAWLKTQAPNKLVLVRRTLLPTPLQPQRLSNRALDDTKNLLVKMIRFGGIATGRSGVRQGVKFYMDQGIRTICSPKKPTCNEATGARSINHFLSSLNHYIQQYVDPSYLSFELYLDDVGSFKSWHVLAFLHHLVEIGRFKQTSLFYYPAGHCQSFSDSIFPQMPSSLRHQDVFNIEELQSAWSKEVGISQAVVLDGREIFMWDSHLLTAYHPFRAMDEFASFQFEEFNGQVEFQASTFPLTTQSASLITQPPIRKSGVPLPCFLTLQESHGQLHDDGKKLGSISSLYERFVSDPSRWPSFIRRYVDHPQEHQDARPACSSTATLDRFTSPLELLQSDDACDWLLSHVRCILTQQQQDDPDLVSRTYLRLFKHPDFIEALTEVSSPLLEDDPSSSAHADHFPSFDTAPTLRPPLYLDNNIFPPSLFQMFGSSSLAGCILPQPTSPTELPFEFEPPTTKRSLADASSGEIPPGWERVDVLSLQRRRMD